MDENQELEERLAQLTQDLRENNIQAFRNSFLEIHIYEQGQFHQSLARENRQLVYPYLLPRGLVDMFDVIEEDNEYMREYLDEMRPSYAVGMLSEIYTDNAVDLLNTSDKKQITKYLSLMPAGNVSEIKELLHYEDRTADTIMTTEFVSIITNQTVRSAMYVLKSGADVVETIHYIYVVNQEDRLVGVISLRDLIVNDDDAMISDLMSGRVLSVHVGDDQEDVAQTFRDYNFLALLATDYDDHLLGIVTIDDVIDVIDNEAAGDHSGLAGANVGEINENPVKTASRRLPWLITLLFLDTSTTPLIGHYEDLIGKANILAVLVSLITGTASNTGAQSLAVAIRRLAISDDKDHGFVRLILAEVLTGAVTGAVTGMTIFLIVGFWKHNLILGFVMGMTMLSAITMTNLIGSLIPMLMDHLGFGPAITDSPFIMALSNLTSVLIYFNIASLFMGYFM